MAGNKAWSQEELDYLKANYHDAPLSALIEHLGRTKHAIEWKASQLGYLIRDGKRVKADNKIIVNITADQKAFLDQKRNHSALIRRLLDQHIKQERDNGQENN